MKNKINFTNQIMSKIKEQQIKMKPKWVFVLGSLIFAVGLFFLVLSVSFLVNLFLFKFHQYQTVVFCPNEKFMPRIFWQRFPFKEFLLSLILLLIGFFLIKKFDFSYKKNTFFIIVSLLAFLISILYFFHKVNFNEKIGKRHLRFFYQENNLNRLKQHDCDEKPRRIFLDREYLL